MNLKESIRRILREESNIPLQLKRRVNNDVLDELIYTVKSLIDSGYDESDAIYDTVRQFIATKQFKLKNDSEQSYWDSYIEVEEPLVDYVKSKLNIQESVLREEMGKNQNSQSDILSNLKNQDQEERREYQKFVQTKFNMDYEKGAKEYVKLKNRSFDDVFGDKERMEKFISINFNFDNFSDEDWENYWLMSQHADLYPNAQKSALQTISQYLGKNNDHYRYLYDRISCRETGAQKYGTQNICEKYSLDNIQESIRRILREESNVPMVIARRVTLDELDKIFERSLDENTEDYENPLSIMYGTSYQTFAKFVIDIMISELEGNFDIPYINDEDEYIKKYREPLLRHYAPIIKDRYMDITSNNVDESVLKEEANPIMRRVFRRIGQEKFDSIFDSGLQTMITRFEQNRHNFHSMTFSKFRDSVIPYVIIELCLTLEDVCLDPNYYEQTLDFLLNNYSGRIKEKWEEINSGNVNESVLNEERVGGKKKLKGLVDEFGLLEASKMIGMSIGKLAEVTNTPIDSDIANQILVEMMNNGELKTKYKDFEIHASSNDVFYWEGMVKTGHFHDDMIENITIAATPFWDGVKYTPVEIEWFTLFNYYGMTVYETSGEGSFYKELKHQTNFESVDELLNWYEEFYLPEVYNLAMNTLLPKMHKLADYEIKQRG